MWKTKNQSIGKYRENKVLHKFIHIIHIMWINKMWKKVEMIKRMFWSLVINQQKVEEMWKKFLTF